MTDPYIGEIRLFAGNVAPTGWAFCNGQVLSINQFTALFSILLTYYGGDEFTFALPDLRGRTPVHPSQGVPMITDSSLGESVGSEAVQLVSAQLPPHSHSLNASTAPANTASPAGAYLTQAQDLNQGLPVSAFTDIGTASAPLQAGAIAMAGGSSQPLSVVQPGLAVNFIIALTGIFPSHP